MTNDLIDKLKFKHGEEKPLVVMSLEDLQNLMALLKKASFKEPVKESLAYSVLDKFEYKDTFVIILNGQ